MQDLFIEFLPPWVETNLQPAFYDRESGTVLQQTARMYAKINEIVKVINKYQDYDEAIKSLQDQINVLTYNLDSLRSSVDSQLDEFMSEVIALVQGQIDNLKRYSDSEDAKLKAYIDDAIIGKIILYNPATGLQDNLQNVINTIYDVSRTGSITASEYDALELTATVYDGKEITAYDYDVNGKAILTQ